MPISHIELDSLFSLSLILPSHTTHTHNIHNTPPSHTHTTYTLSPPLFLLFPISTLSRPDQKLTPHFLSLYATTCPYFPPLDALHRRYKGKLRQPPSPLFLSHPSCERGTTGPILHSIIFFSSSSIRELVLEDGKSSTQGDIGIDTGSFPDDQTFPVSCHTTPTAIHSKTLLQDRFAQRSPPTYLQYQ